MSNKVCQKCGRKCDDYEKFCPNCGSDQFNYSDFEETTILNNNPMNSSSEKFTGAAQPQYQQPMYSQNYQQGNANINPTNMQPVPKKKGLKGWQIALIVVGVLVLAGIGYVAENTFQNEGYSSDTVSKSSVTVGEQSETDYKASSSYTKGEIKNGYYLNEWANIKFRLTDDWPEAISSDYSTYENTTTDCGFLSSEELSGKKFAVQFENLSMYSKDYSSDEYLNVFKEQIENQFKNNNIAYTINESTITIAGENYSVLKTQFTDNGLYMYNCCKIVDKRAVVITVALYNESDIINVLASITEY